MSTPETPAGGIMAETTAAPAAAKAWLVEDFIDIFYAPTSVFTRRMDGRFGIALLMLAVASTLVFIATRGLMQAVWDAEFARQMQETMARNPQITAEQMQASRGMMSWFLPVTQLVGIPLIVLVLGLIVWGVGKLFEVQQTYKLACVVVTYSLFPRLLEPFVGGLQARFMDASSITSRFSVSLGLGRFVDPDNQLLMALLGRVDLFTLWVTALIGIGIYVTGKTSKANAAMAAGVVWLIGALPLLFGALR